MVRKESKINLLFPRSMIVSIITVIVLGVLTFRWQWHFVVGVLIGMIIMVYQFLHPSDMLKSLVRKRYE